MRLVKTITISLVLLLSGCSTFGFFFERLDWIAVWKMDKMFDLSGRQEAILEPAALNVRDWLRTEGFPDLIAKLENAKSYWELGEHEQALAYFEMAGEEWFDIFSQELWSEVKPLVLTMKERNAAQYREYTEDNYDDWFDYAESEENKIDVRVERLEEWFGRLSDAQEDIVREHIKLQPNERGIRIKNSMQWRENFLAFAMARDEVVLDSWIAAPEMWWTSEFIALREANLLADRTMSHAIFATLSEKQKRKAIERVDDWIEALSDVLEP